MTDAWESIPYPDGTPVIPIWETPAPTPVPVAPTPQQPAIVIPPDATPEQEQMIRDAIANANLDLFNPDDTQAILDIIDFVVSEPEPSPVTPSPLPSPTPSPVVTIPTDATDAQKEMIRAAIENANLDILNPNDAQAILDIIQFVMGPTPSTELPPDPVDDIDIPEDANDPVNQDDPDLVADDPAIDDDSTEEPAQDPLDDYEQDVIEHDSGYVPTPSLSIDQQIELLKKLNDAGAVIVSDDDTKKYDLVKAVNSGLTATELVPLFGANAYSEAVRANRALSAQRIIESAGGIESAILQGVDIDTLIEAGYKRENIEDYKNYLEELERQLDNIAAVTGIPKSKLKEIQETEGNDGVQSLVEAHNKLQQAKLEKWANEVAEQTGLDAQVLLDTLNREGSKGVQSLVDEHLAISERRSQPIVDYSDYRSVFKSLSPEEQQEYVAEGIRQTLLNKTERSPLADVPFAELPPEFQEMVMGHFAIKQGYETNITGTVKGIAQAFKDDPLGTAVSIVPVVGTIKDWDDMSIGWQAASLILDATVVLGVVGRVAAGARVAKGAGTLARSKAVATAAKDVAIAEIKAPIKIATHPIETTKGMIKALTADVKPYVFPKNIPLSTTEVRTTTVRLPKGTLGSADDAMVIRDAAIDAASSGTSGKVASVTIGDTTVDLSTKTIQRLGKPMLVHGTQDIRPFLEGATVNYGREGGIWLSPNLHTDFTLASAFGDYTEGGVRGALLIRDPEILRQVEESGKIFESAKGPVAEVEALLPAGVKLPKPSQILYTQDVNGNTLKLLVYGDKFSTGELAQLKWSGPADLAQDLFVDPYKITKGGKKVALDYDDLNTTRRTLNSKTAELSQIGKGEVAARTKLEKEIRALNRRIDDYIRRVERGQGTIATTGIVMATRDDGLIDRFSSIGGTKRSVTKKPSGEIVRYDKVDIERDIRPIIVDNVKLPEVVPDMERVDRPISRTSDGVIVVTDTGETRRDRVTEPVEPEIVIPPRIDGGRDEPIRPSEVPVQELTRVPVIPEDERLRLPDQTPSESSRILSSPTDVRIPPPPSDEPVRFPPTNGEPDRPFTPPDEPSRPPRKPPTTGIPEVPATGTPILPRLSLEAKKKLGIDDRGTIAWYQGRFGDNEIWYVVKYPYKTKADVTRYIGVTPPGISGVEHGDNAAYRSIQLLIGTPPRKLSIDLGIQDIMIESPGKMGKAGSIQYKADPKQKSKSKISVKGAKTLRTVRKNSPALTSVRA